MNDVESINEHFCIARIFRIDSDSVNKYRFVICFEMSWCGAYSFQLKKYTGKIIIDTTGFTQ